MITVLVVLLGLTQLACKPETAIDITTSTDVPPSFSFSGPWWARDFYILEVNPQLNSQGRHDFGKDKIIWKISLGYNRGKDARLWPVVSYGKIPDGFVQDIPALGSAPRLDENRIYAAEAVDNIGNGGVCYFIIRDGQAQTLPPSQVFPTGRP